MKQVEVEDDENLYQDISSSIMEKGIDELKKFEDHFTENLFVFENFPTPQNFSAVRKVEVDKCKDREWT